MLRALTLGPYRRFVVRRSVRQVLNEQSGGRHRIDRSLHYGAIYLDARHLAIWYLVKTNQELARAKSDGFEAQLQSQTRAVLKRNGYPAAVLPHVSIQLESSENVERGGGWFRYFR